MRSEQRLAYERWVASHTEPIHPHAWLGWREAMKQYEIANPLPRAPTSNQKFMCAKCHTPKIVLGRKMKRIDGLRQYVCTECQKGSPSGSTEKHASPERSAAPAPQRDGAAEVCREEAEA